LKEIISPNLKKTPKSLIKFNDERIDNYYWLKERENPRVIEYLNSENDYYRKMTLTLRIFKTSYSMKLKIKSKRKINPFHIF